MLWLQLNIPGWEISILVQFVENSGYPTVGIGIIATCRCGMSVWAVVCLATVTRVSWITLEIPMKYFRISFDYLNWKYTMDLGLR